MVGRRPAAALAAAVLLAAAAARSPAEVDVGVRLRLLQTALRDPSAGWSVFPLGTSRVSLSSASESVKAELAVDGLLGEGLSASLARALVSVRFPGLRITTGKARLSWGEGVAFNAADLLDGSFTVSGLDLTQDVLRDDASWLAALFVPLGQFSFAEAVVLPQPVDVAGLLSNPAAPLPPLSAASAGARVVGKIAGIKTEVDYLVRGATGMHHAAVSLQGNLLVDWHLSASTAFPVASPAGGDLLDNLRLSAGAFHLQRLGERAVLSLRLEALAAPAGEWRESEAVVPPLPVYGLLLYPEASLSIDTSVTVSARALVSPVDGSAVIVPGVSVSLHKGLALLAMAGISLGDATDTWAWSRRGGLSLMAGCSFVY